MTALFVIGSILGCVLAYVAIGAFLTRTQVGQITRRHTYRIIGYEYPAMRSGAIYSDLPDGTPNRAKINASLAWLVVLWPVLFPVAVIGASLNKQVDLLDPAVARRREKRIRELESELDIGKEPT